MKLNVNLVGFSASYEARLARRFTLNLEAGAGYSFYYGNSYFGEDFGYALAPFVAAENRYYYNLEKRERKGKSIRNNAANFLSATLRYDMVPVAYEDLYNNPRISLRPAWGFQRSIGRRFSFETLLGWSIRYDTQLKEWEHSPAVNFKLGYFLWRTSDTK